MLKKCPDCSALESKKGVKKTVNGIYTDSVDINYCKFCGSKLVPTERWDLSGDS